MYYDDRLLYPSDIVSLISSSSLSRWFERKLTDWHIGIMVMGCQLPINLEYSTREQPPLAPRALQYELQYSIAYSILIRSPLGL